MTPEHKRGLQALWAWPAFIVMVSWPVLLLLAVALATAYVLPVAWGHIIAPVTLIVLAVYAWKQRQS